MQIQIKLVLTVILVLVSKIAIYEMFIPLLFFLVSLPVFAAASKDSEIPYRDTANPGRP